MEEKNISDNVIYIYLLTIFKIYMNYQDIIQIMKFAHLDYIIEREGGLNSINDWGDVLSGGEK